MSVPKDHHYVPRGFFKPWADEIKKVIVYERKNGLILPPYRQSTKAICVQNGLYSYTDSVEEQKRNLIEQKLFSLVDTNAARILQQFQKMDGLVNLPDQDRYHFAVFIFSLRVRTPEAFEYNVQRAGKVFREMLIKNDPVLEKEKIKETLQSKNLLEWVEKNHPVILENYGQHLMAEYIIDEKFASKIMQMDWVVLKRSFSGTNLLSSDRPLVLLGNLQDLNLGFALTISPEHIFIATSKPNAIEKILNLPPKILIKRMNVSTIQQAKNKAFGIDDCHSIRFFENRLGTHHGILPWTTIESS